MLDRLEKLLEWGGTRRKVALLSVSGLALLMSMLGMEPLPFEISWIAIVLCGVPIVLEAVLGLATAWDIKADVLVSVALVASVIIGEDFAAAEIAFIMQLGELLEELTVARARKGIERLVRLTPATARKVEGTREEVIPTEEVRIGDILRVLPGETIPADGVILSGHTSVNQSVMTGEPLPIDKEAGDEVSSGTVNQFGTFDMKAARTGKDSSIQRMVRLVQSADAGKAKIVRLADRWATWIVAIALVSAGGAWMATDELIRAVTILVVFCPCALVLATPTAVMAAIGNATRHGFLVREGDALERLSCVSHLTFDKTGTLTCGAPRVAAVRSFLPELPEQELYRYAACAELRSEHPLGKAIVRCYRKDSVRELPQPEQFRMIPGRGVRAVAQGKELLAGNLELFRENGVELSDEARRAAERYQEEGCSVIFIGMNRQAAGVIALSDTLRENAVATIREVRDAGVVPVLLTGDHGNAAARVAGQLGIDLVCAECLPEDKFNWIDACQKERNRVCMVGDGINDALALKTSHAGIAMGGIGSDIAVDAADIVLVNDDIRELPHLLRLSRRMMGTIKCNLTFSMALNFIAIILAAGGILGPVAGALVHNAGSVVVIANSVFLLKWRRKTRESAWRVGKLPRVDCREGTESVFLTLSGFTAPGWKTLG